MHKKYTKHHLTLVAELASLRKGSGLTPAKLQGKAGIQEVIARTHNGSGFTNSQIHNLLLTEISKLPNSTTSTALRYAFCLDDNIQACNTLFQRRRELADRLGKHPDTIIRYENQAIHNLALQLEEPTSTSPLLLSPQDAGARQLQTTALHTAAVASLSGLLPIATHAPELVNYLEQSQRPYLEMNIDITFSASPRGTNWYRVETAYNFQGKRSAFRLAVVLDNEDGEYLIAQGLIDDFHKLNDRVDPKREIRTIINGSRFIAYDRMAATQKLLRFQELDPNEVNLLLQSVGKPLKSYCRFLEVTIPAQWQKENIDYEYRSSFSLRDDIHYAYWYAPSMMFLKKLTFDYSQFPSAASWNFIVMPFLGNITAESTRTSHSFITRPTNWIMPGHGIALMWEAKA
jgi:hypothetical protein